MTLKLPTAPLSPSFNFVHPSRLVLKCNQSIYVITISVSIKDELLLIKQTASVMLDTFGSSFGPSEVRILYCLVCPYFYHVCSMLVGLGDKKRPRRGPPFGTSRFLVRAACVHSHRTKCPLLTAFFSLSFFLSLP